jgi:methyl-accepting chemotaxis protein
MSLTILGLGRAAVHANSGAIRNSDETDPRIAVEAVIKILDDLLHHRPLDLGDLPADLAQAVTRFRQALSARDSESLKNAVAYSMHASNAMASTAFITGEVRETNTRAQSMASAIEELTTSIQQISRSAGQASDAMQGVAGHVSGAAETAQSAADASRNIGQAFAGMAAARTELKNAAEQIASFVTTIEAIARQTNLLALNATIEAARAGEAGRGFAVVASEVKALSSQTQKATEDIRARMNRLDEQVTALVTGIDEVSNLVETSVERADTASVTISTVREDAAGISDRIGEIAAVIKQQTEAVADLSAAMQVIAGNTARAAEHADAVLKAVGSSEKLINETFVDLEARNIPTYVLQRAKSDHCLWKKRLSEMLVGLNNLTAAELSDHHQCRLGKWYDIAASGPIGSQPQFRAIAQPHEAVHRHGREVARLFAAGDRECAIAAFVEMEKASVSVISGLDALLANLP